MMLLQKINKLEAIAQPFSDEGPIRDHINIDLEHFTYRKYKWHDKGWVMYEQFHMVILAHLIKYPNL